MELDYLNFVASVRDDFSDTLNELSRDLAEVGLLAEAVDQRLNFDVDVDDSELKKLDKELSTRSVTGGDGPAEPHSVGDGGGSRSTTTADGGATDVLSTNDIRRLRDNFGDVFDESSFIRQGGQVPDWWQTLNDRDLADIIDFDALADDDEMLRRFGSIQNMDIDAAIDFFEDLDDLDIADLPGRDNRGPLRTFFETIDEGDLTMNTFYNILARLIPLLATFVAALPAAIAGVAGLAAAGIGAGGGVAAIAGLGALGFADERGMSLQEFTDHVRTRLTDSFTEAFTPLGRRFTPMFEDALDGIDDLFEALAARGDSLAMLRDDARAFGSFVLDVLPEKLDRLVQLGDAAGEAFGALGQWIEDTDFAGGFATVLGDILPMLTRLGVSLLSLLPLVIDLSEGFLFTATALTWMIGGLVEASSALQFFEAWTGVGIESLAALTGLLFVLSTVLGFNMIPMLAAAGKAIYGLIIAMKAAELSALQWAAATAIATAGLSVLAGVAAFAAGKVSLVGDNIGDATSNLREFGRVSGRINDDALATSGGLADPNGGSVYIDYTDNSETTNEVNSVDDGVAVSSFQNYREGSTLDGVMG